MDERRLRDLSQRLPKQQAGREDDQQRQAEQRISPQAVSHVGETDADHRGQEESH
jgi:hypothetical protein